jgi:hypothetical protein
MTQLINKSSVWNNRVAGVALLPFCLFACYLFLGSLQAKPFSDGQLMRDLMWLDSWALCFFVLVVLVFRTGHSWKTKAWLYIGIFSVYGLVTYSVIFNGTPYSLHAFWGDQAYRQAMILKFVTFACPMDFFYKDLPAFYPPVYFLLLSFWSRLFSVEAFKMLKIGGMFIYFVGPILLYILWSRLVSPFRALLVTVASFLYCAFNHFISAYSPPAFLGNIFFVPWWLIYIEQVRSPAGDWKHYLSGGLIGGLIFMTYPYPFFIGGFLLLLRSTALLKWNYLWGDNTSRLKQAWMVLGCAALFSAPYWLPPLVAILIQGGKPLDQEYLRFHHTGLKFKFLEFSVPGLLFLGSIYYALRRPHKPLNRGLLMLVGGALLFYLLGSLLALLGSIDRPVNLPKAKEFIVFLAGPLVGLGLAGTMRLGRRRKKGGTAVAVVASLILLFFCRTLNSNVTHEQVKTARKSTGRSWDFDSAEMLQRQGRVFLLADVTFPAFYPVYVFIANNQHYSHPASRFVQRWDFLCLLQEINDPFLFHTALKHNVFDRVDYFMPLVKSGQMEIPFHLSNYPLGSLRRSLRISPEVVSDKKLFVKEQGFHLYRLEEGPATVPRGAFSFETMSARDSLRFLYRLKLISEYLDSTGAGLVSSYVNTDWSCWKDVMLGQEPFEFDSRIPMISCYTVSTGDSLTLIAAFKPNHDIEDKYRIFLHVYGQEDPTHLCNYDFWPETQTDLWKKGDIIICSKSFPDPGDSFNFTLGFFYADRRLPNTYNGRVGNSPSD